MGKILHLKIIICVAGVTWISREYISHKLKKKSLRLSKRELVADSFDDPLTCTPETKIRETRTYQSDRDYFVSYCQQWCFACRLRAKIVPLSQIESRKVICKPYRGFGNMHVRTVCDWNLFNYLSFPILLASIAKQDFYQNVLEALFGW